jgi:hypothetical protein
VKNNKKFLPVIHCKDIDQAGEQVRIALDNGADGVFLIENLSVLPQIRHEFPNAWIGVNQLNWDPDNDDFISLGSDLLKQINGLWSDNAGEAITECGDTSKLQDIYRKHYSINKDLEYFGGVAFKYQNQPKFLAKSTKLAMDCMDVICTSGPGTGKAPDIDKICAMHLATCDDLSLPDKSRRYRKPLAIASGLTAKNVVHFLPYVDYFLVATGISKDWRTLDPKAVRAFAKAIGK